MNNKRTLFTQVIAAIVLLIAISTNAQQSTDITADAKSKLKPELKPEFSPMPAAQNVQANEQGVAIDGFDPVAYFDEGKAVKGDEIHSCEYLNKTWHFSSAENRDKFLSNPEKFSPQYGGYCAHSLTKNRLVESNPEAFAVRDDKLYLYVNENQAKKDTKRKETKFKFNKTERDKNWLTYQSDF